MMKVIEQSGVGGTPSRYFAEEEFSDKARFTLPAKYQSFVARLTDLAG
jgi:hypothetical protein